MPTADQIDAAANAMHALERQGWCPSHFDYARAALEAAESRALEQGKIDDATLQREKDLNGSWKMASIFAAVSAVTIAAVALTALSAMLFGS